MKKRFTKEELEKYTSKRKEIINDRKKMYNIWYVEGDDKPWKVQMSRGVAQYSTEERAKQMAKIFSPFKQSLLKEFEDENIKKSEKKRGRKHK